MDWLVEWDRATFFALNHALRSPLMDRVMPFVTDLGLFHVQAALALGAAAAVAYVSGDLRRGGRMGIAAALFHRCSWLGPFLLSITLSGLMAQAFKVIPGQRPWWYYANQHARGLDLDKQVMRVEGVYALKVRRFPSGHTATSTAAATVLTWLFVRKRRGLWLAAGAWILALAVAYSRIYLASHWPLDLVGGAAMGIAAGVASVFIWRIGAARGKRCAAE